MTKICPIYSEIMISKGTVKKERKKEKKNNSNPILLYPNY